MADIIVNQKTKLINLWIAEQEHVIKLIAKNSIIINSLVTPDKNRSEKAKEYLIEFNSNHPYINAIAIVAAQDIQLDQTIYKKNHVVYASNYEEKIKNLDYSYLTGYQKIIDNKYQFYVTNIINSYATDKPSIFFMHRVENNGKLLGTIIYSFDNSYINNYLMQDISIDKTGFFYLLSENEIISHSKQNLILSEDTYVNTFVKNLTDKVLIGDYLTTETFNNANKFYYTKPLLVDTVLLDNAGFESTWNIGAVQDSAEVHSGAFNDILLYCIFSALSLVLVTILAIFFTNKYMNKPLSELARIIRKFAKVREI